jgi:hypothetical protein
LAGVCATDNKSALPPHQPAPTVREAAAEAARIAGTHKGAASDIGIDRSRFTHKLSEGTLNLKELEALGPTFAVKFATELLERFGPLVTPHARARHLLRENSRINEELAQIIDFLGERSA